MTGADQSSDLLTELERLLDSDPLMDEVGFIHPSQFAELRKEAGSTSKDGLMGSAQTEANTFDLVFWSRDHKLGISTTALLPLYKAAKHAFMEAIRQYQTLTDLQRERDDSKDDNASTFTSSSISILESDVMKHSRALLLLSCDFGTAWNCRKVVVSKLQLLHTYMDELNLSSLVLSYAPKSERAWNHRRWVIKMIAGKCPNLQEIIERESEFVEKLAERSKMNYRAWNHRCWLVSYMSGEQVLHELNKSRDWAGLHVADNSCFHYRTRLLLKILEGYDDQNSAASSATNFHELWKKELDWVATLIKCYVGREALWLYRRFLSLTWINHFTTQVHSNSFGSCPKNMMNVKVFMSNELQLCHYCSSIPDNDFEDYQAQATFSATYIMWITRQVAGSLQVELRKKLEANGLKTQVNNVCPEKSFLWNTFSESI
ncbi:protein prenyltransferase alpha subunit repeat-containing protein 1 [Coffea eugenioides]|uniref:protein prenyltransferase alpha subunit repeat-containing protein 1 n=1 Tax=Coffea eugenioides TaxID=49369 RepID=UPI000F60CC8A|nr:protein prenyltransferase alpha subunit repeat-containing protein 1 [Coffea eugenioides]